MQVQALRASRAIPRQLTLRAMRPVILTTRKCATVVRGLAGGANQARRHLSSSTTAIFAVYGIEQMTDSSARAPPLVAAAAGTLLTSTRRPCSGILPLSTLGRRRKLSTTKDTGKGTAAPKNIRGFGRRQKPADSGNTALGKGYDLMEDDPGSRKKIVIGGYDPHGFQLGDGVDVRGSMICLPNSYVLWKPTRSADITVESLRLLELVTPKIDLVIVGVGERMTERLDPVLVKHLGSKGIRVEQMDTVNACSTFNVLNAEDRRVAAALIQLSDGEDSD